MKRTSKVNTSNRPNNIVTIRIHFPVGFMAVKFSATEPNPGPKLFSVAAIAAKAENSSIPLAINNNKLIIKTNDKQKKNKQLQ